jgi:hypothetical protein
VVATRPSSLLLAIVLFRIVALMPPVLLDPSMATPKTFPSMRTLSSATCAVPPGCGCTRRPVPVPLLTLHPLLMMLLEIISLAGPVGKNLMLLPNAAPTM